MSDKPRLVLVDDSEIVLEVMRDRLTQAGFDVRPVSSLRKFVNSVFDWKPHLIVTDLYMPDMSGAELCKWLRSQVETARIPVIICSSASDDELERVARDVGADGYVSKQSGLDALPTRLHALCEEIVF